MASTPSLRSVSSPASHQQIEIPTHWHPETQHCLESKIVSNEARNDIVRTLVTFLIAKHVSKASRRQYEQMARVENLQYPFLRDDLGPGYVSY